MFEEYRYDALGRRVWVRARQFCRQLDEDRVGLCQLSKIRRIVWDGQQELYEIQMPGEDGSEYLENDTAPVSLEMFGIFENPASGAAKIDPNAFFGRVAYVHGAALDQPLAVIRMGYGDQVSATGQVVAHRSVDPFVIAPLWNERGQAVTGVFEDGGIRKCVQQGQALRCVYVDWPALWFAYVRPKLDYHFWHGSLLEDKQDATGTNFRRNRYYDPQNGRFTQEDPIGLAGGLNLYGFAAGDPVNFSDPFGLCPQWLTGRPCGGMLDLAAGSVPGLSTTLDVATALSARTLSRANRLESAAASSLLLVLLFPLAVGRSGHWDESARRC